MLLGPLEVTVPLPPPSLNTFEQMYDLDGAACDASFMRFSIKRPVQEQLSLIDSFIDDSSPSTTMLSFFPNMTSSVLSTYHS